MICPYCEYEWTPRTDKPKRCPKCQRWLPPWSGLYKKTLPKEIDKLKKKLESEDKEKVAEAIKEMGQIMREAKRELGRIKNKVTENE